MTRSFVHTGALTVAIDAIWAWIELYEKRDGEWRIIGNVSNRRP